MLPVAVLLAGAGVWWGSRDGIRVTYSPAFDAVCSLVHGGAIREEWKSELRATSEEFNRMWAGTGPRLLEEARVLTGIAPPGSADVRLTLCDLPSQSVLGITVNMRFALHSFTPAPVPMRYKVDVLIHELLHRMLGGKVPADSLLLAQHSAEPSCVRDHVHLLALQKAVLLAADERQALADVMRHDGLLPNDCYRRAWILVNASDGAYLAYVSELRQQSLMHGRHH